MEKEKFGLVPAASLPFDILLLVFKHLSVRDLGQASQVCSTWRDAAYQKSLWKEVEVKLYLRVADQSCIFSNLVRRGIKQIIAVPCYDNGLHELLLGVPNIESLKVPSFKCGHDCLTVGSFLSNALEYAALKHLVLNSCLDVGDKTAQYISCGLVNLSNLDLCHTNITDTGLKYIASMTQLQKLSLSWCRRISDTGISHLVKGNLDVTGNAIGLMSLQYLDVGFCRNLTDRALRDIVGLVNLKSINFSGTSITDHGLKHIALMKNLEQLSLASCDISDTGFFNLTKGPSNKCTAEALPLTRPPLGHLKSLNIERTAISNGGLKHIEKLKNLQELNVANCHVSRPQLCLFARMNPILTKLVVFRDVIWQGRSEIARRFQHVGLQISDT